METALEDFRQRNLVGRIWQKDHTVWKPDPKEITDRLGWLTVTDMMGEQVPAPEAFANEALVQSMTEMGYTEWTAQGFAELMDGFKDGFAKEATDNVERLTGHPARSVETFAHDFAGFFGGGS